MTHITVIGAGYAVSWGCAMTVIDLIQQGL